MFTRYLLTATAALLLLAGSAVQAQEIDWDNFDPKTATPEEWERVLDFMDRRTDEVLAKTTGSMGEIKSLIINGNKITTVVYNYGNITRPNTLGNIADLVWNNLGNGFEFTPLVGGEVVDVNGDTVHILDDGMWLPTQGGYAPDGTLKWGWLPKPGFAAPDQPDIAAWSHRSDVQGDLTRKPHSWPQSWFNSALGRYVWPAFLGDDATSPDEEVFFICDDYTNEKYQYYPFPDDSSKRGLGLDLECRFFQFNNPLAEDIIFLVYRVTNRSPKTISKVYFGMYGDPHVGGPSDYSDDRAFFIPPTGELADPFPQRSRSMVYAWDEDGRGDGGLPTGYFGFKFLESPTNSVDGEDNDDDGITDESPFNEAGVFIDGINIPVETGISDVDKYTEVYGAPKPRWSGDEDGDWDVEKNDVGIDGLAETGDFGEGNGQPDVGVDADGNIVSEPNFGIRDVSESDQIGLTSFWALPYTQSIPNVPKDDVHFWGLLSSDSISIDQELLVTPGDNIFVYGSGPFVLEPGATQRFSIALLMGDSRDDLVLNSETAQRILEANYLFAQPPPKPIVSAVPGDGRVTLYWDNQAEQTVDPLTGTQDFEGYKIYRSLDYTFSDVVTITDANGSPFLRSPLIGATGDPAQFDLVNQWEGLHPVEYLGRGIKYNLGKNTGLVHEYIDSTVANGVTYYYGVASYEHGFDSLGIQLPPTESQISITRDPVTGTLTFDQNTAAVAPGPLPSGSTNPQVSNDFTAERIQGNSTGEISIGVKEALAVEDQAQYSVNFRDMDGSIVYDAETFLRTIDNIVSKDTFFVPLSKKSIIDTTVVVRDGVGATVDTSRYEIDAEGGQIRGTSPGSMPAGEEFEVSYRNLPVYASPFLQGEDSNPVFDGIRLYVQDDVLGIDSADSRWIVQQNNNVVGVVQKPQALPSAPFRPAPINLEVRWNNTDTTSDGKWASPGDTLLNNRGQPVVVCPFKIVDVTSGADLRVLVDKALEDSIWRLGRELVVVTPPPYAPQSPIPVMVGILFYPPADSNEATIMPQQGDIYLVASTKPFEDGDVYTFTTTAVRFDQATAQSMLENIYVVPDPYVVWSGLETPGINSTLRGENRLQFRNLPAVCTIRIYTITGELIDTIYKDDSNSFAEWAVVSNEGQRLAYGIYIYHVDVPGVGEKIGRFALIK
jgi:hypothetical protein